MTDTPAPVVLSVPARSGEVRLVRRAIDALGRDAGLEPSRLADVSLAVGEACANAVVHAYPEGEEGVLNVRAEITGDGLLQVVVADEGRGMYPRSDSPGLGLGLPLMAALATVIEVRAASGGGTEIRMVFAVESPASGASWAKAG